ncbi:hypothetical protein XH88_18560 [Bradyrhizobium sp. CCBAU 51627]|nr:hypothetical protein [Bradyrhizobium sp. CCBAU 51627]
MESGMGSSHLVSTVNARINVETTSGTAYAIAYFEDQQPGKINVGQPATVDIDLLADHTFHGHIVEVSEKRSEARTLISGQDSASIGKTVVAVKIAFDEAVDSVALLPDASVLLTIDTEAKHEGFATNLSHRCACLSRPPIDAFRATNPVD